MIVRTYGRRSRSFSDSLDEDDDDLPAHAFGGESFSLSQESPAQNFYDFPFSSQESSSFWASASSSFDPDSYGFNPSSSQDNLPPGDGGASRKSKKPRNGTLERRGGGGGARPWVPMTSTLMETQEFGEMMEHVDEVNFALDGLRRGQPVRIRRASLLSLLSICGTAQQRRLLRAQGTVKTIMDAVLGLSFDDAPSNLAAATLFFLLTSDGQDDHMLESPSCILFLLQLLKPVRSTATQDKTQSLGSKLLSIRRDTNTLRDTSKTVDSSSSAILAKVEEILVSGKIIKSQSGHNMGAERPELTSKYIALLTMEKACLSRISLEDTSGRVRKLDGNFKEKLRELGGLDAVFEVAMSCHSAIERLEQQNQSSSQSAQYVLVLPSLVTLLKCLKIMENATFLSKDNQDHLLAMKRNSDSHGCRISFTKLVISVIKILSGLYLRRASATSADGNPTSLSNGSNHDYKVDSEGVICISSSESECYVAGERGSQNSHKSIAQRVLSASREAASMDDSNLLKMRVRSSMFSSSSETSRTCNGSRSKYDPIDGDDSAKDSMCELFDSQDPFAFDDGDFEPSKWDVKYGKPKKSRPPAARKPSKEHRNNENPLDVITIPSESSKQLDEDSSKRQCSSRKDSNSSVSDEECSTLLSDCLLTSVKVLMNLTNENPVGCRQVAGCKGLETMSSLIADHFPSFDSSSSSPNSAAIEHQNEGRLTDQELDFLVAILGLLVNLVEKDGQNRSRLALASVSLASSQGSEGESRKDVIPLLCSIFLAHQGEGDQSEQGNAIQWDDEVALLEGEKEAEKMIVEAYAALLLAFLSTESKSTRDSIADCLPDHKLSALVPVLERFVAFHLTLNMISPETHEAVKEVIESCRLP